MAIVDLLLALGGCGLAVLIILHQRKGLQLAKEAIAQMKEESLRQKQNFHAQLLKIQDRQSAENAKREVAIKEASERLIRSLASCYSTILELVGEETFAIYMHMVQKLHQPRCYDHNRRQITSPPSDSTDRESLPPSP